MPTSSQLHPTTRPPGMGRLDLRDLLLLGGAGKFAAEMSINYMNYLPGTCEPYAQGVIQIVKGLQRLLNARGAALEVDGGLGDATQKALQKFAGPRWYEKSWAQLYLDVIGGKRWKGAARVDRSGIERDAATNQLMQGMGGVWDSIRAPVTRMMQTREPTYPDWVDPVPPRKPWLPRPKHALGGYLRGMGDVVSGWELRNGVAIPLTPTMLAYFQSIQRAINGINAKEGRALVAVDGRIGKQTASALVPIVLKHGSGELAGGDITPTFVATNAPEIVGELMDLMKRIGGTFVPDPKTSSPPSTLKPDGSINNPSDTTDTTKLVLAAVAIGAVVAVVSRKKRKR